jgi:hypothetical protein
MDVDVDMDMDIDNGTQDELRLAISVQVYDSFNAAKSSNRVKFLRGDSSATSEYIYENQKEDSQKIIEEFKKGRRVISVQKRTKVGADGLMICLAVDMGMENGDLFTDPENVRIITGMSNCEWEKGMIEKCPEIYKDKIFHHGQLPKAGLRNLKNALIIIDEIDSGDKENQVLHKILEDAGVLDVKSMSENNIRFILISATPIRELYELDKWGTLHESIRMSIPSSYIGHGDFLKMGIIQEFYSINNRADAERWIHEDILPYGTDFRVHIIRVNEKSAKGIEEACKINKIKFNDHNSTERLKACELKRIFEEPLKKHVVLCVKGFYRRANLIPNKWKLRIGATHELYVDKPDNNVQIQGLPGRMTGYWRDIVESGHKTGPYRTSIKSVDEYEKVYLDPFGDNSYRTFGFKKNSIEKISQTTTTFLNHTHIKNLTVVETPKPEKQYTGPGPFENAISAKKWCTENLNCKKSVCWPHDEPNGTPSATGTFCFQGGGGSWRKITTLSETIKDLEWGVCSSARIIPILGGNPYKYIIAYKQDKLKFKVLTTD